MELKPKPNYPNNFQSCHNLIEMKLKCLSAERNKIELNDKECVVCGFVQFSENFQNKRKRR